MFCNGEIELKTLENCVVGVMWNSNGGRNT